MIYDGFQQDSVYDGFQPFNMWIPKKSNEILATELLQRGSISHEAEKSTESTVVYCKSSNQLVVDLILL